MKSSYESLKEIRVDVVEMWRKMLGFRVSIGLLPLILIISWNEIQLWRFERNWSWCWWDMKENVRFWSKYRVITLILIVSWNEIQLWRFESLKEIGVDVDEIWRKMLGFGVCIGLLPLILIVSWNEIQLWRFESLKEIGVDVDEIWRKMLGFGVCIGLLPLILIVSWNEIQLWKFERNWSWCWWDMKENVRFWSMYRVVTPYFDHLMKWNPVMKVWKKLELMLMRYEGKC